MKKKPARITIVGAGLVGTLLSIYLARRGYKVTIFERRYDMRTHILGAGRSINLALSNRGIRALEEVGLATQMKENSVPMRGRLMHDVQGNKTFQPYGKDGQFINSISRTGLNIVLLDEAKRLGVDINFEHLCTHINIEQTRLIFQRHGDTIHHEADVIIGADGAYSAVRQQLQNSDRFDFSQHYIEHGYKELRIPPGEKGEFQMEREALHIWPRESFMLIALPNPDATFTCTLFYPMEGKNSFRQFQSDQDVHRFFMKEFSDAVPLMPSLIEDFRDNPTSSLVTIRCFPWVRNNIMLIGDAAHGVVPFYGQGMNAGFEDCRVLNELLETYKDDWSLAVPEYERLRKPDGDAIAQLALDNFVEMRDLVADPSFLLRKKIEARLHDRYPDRWIPLYSMVTFQDNIRYSDAQAIGRRQAMIMDQVMLSPDIEKNWENLDYESIVSQLTPR